MSYLAAAQRTGEWLLATAERSPAGWSWPAQPGVSAEVGPLDLHRLDGRCAGNVMASAPMCDLGW